MSKASSRADAAAESWIERWQHWIAALSSALLHLLFLLLALWSSRVVVTTSQGAAARQRGATTQTRSEARLRTWRDQGMTELFLPLPGTLRR